MRVQPSGVVKPSGDIMDLTSGQIDHLMRTSDAFRTNADNTSSFLLEEVQKRARDCVTLANHCREAVGNLIANTQLFVEDKVSEEYVDASLNKTLRAISESNLCPDKLNSSLDTFFTDVRVLM